MEKRWKILTADKEKTIALQEALKIHPLLCKIFVIRGIELYDQAKDFFRPSLTDLPSPWLMKDMEKAVERLSTAIVAN